MGWNIDPQCKCRREISSIKYYVWDCELFAENRDSFVQFVKRRFHSDEFLCAHWDLLLFNPNMEIAMEVGKFLKVEGIII